ncbi:MAG: competence/damage-inducible protein CinA [Deltaproteobacteria bacterium]|nr:competence/damage-inducible protein CinA [Deltaproteobacteria bacterium]
MTEVLEVVLGEALRGKKATVAVAESCTGGLISHRITNVPGSSAYFERGIVAYSNQAKVDHLGVSEKILNDYGAVSSETAMAMASGIRKVANATFGLAVTGIAGPGGGTPEKPVGLVYIAIASPDGTEVSNFRFGGDRASIKVKTADAALKWLVSKVNNL